MYAYADSQFRPLTAVIPEEIDWLSSDLMAAQMNVSMGQMRRDVAVLRKLELIQLDELKRESEITEMYPDPDRKKPFRCRRRGFTREEAEIIWLFRQAVRQRGRALAIKSIYQIVEDFYHDE